MEGNRGSPSLMTLTYTIKVKLRLSAESDSDRRMEVGRGWKGL